MLTYGLFDLGESELLGWVRVPRTGPSSWWVVDRVRRGPVDDALRAVVSGAGPS